MIRHYDDGEVLTGVQRQRQCTPEEKVRVVEETYLPGMSVSLVALLPTSTHQRQSGLHLAQADVSGALTAAAAAEEVEPASA
jgi:transposase